MQEGIFIEPHLNKFNSIIRYLLSLIIIIIVKFFNKGRCKKLIFPEDLIAKHEGGKNEKNVEGLLFKRC